MKSFIEWVGYRDGGSFGFIYEEKGDKYELIVPNSCGGDKSRNDGVFLFKDSFRYNSDSVEILDYKSARKMYDSLMIPVDKYDRIKYFKLGLEIELRLNND